MGSRQTPPDWPLFIAEGEETRYVGDMLAAVAAETRAATDGRLTIPVPASCVAVTGFQLMPSRIEPNAPIREIEVLGVPAP